MKITTPNGTIIELTPEEAEALFPELIRETRRQLAGLAGGEGGAADPPPTAERLVRRVLRRRHHIPPAQRALFRALYDAGDEGLEFVALARAIGRSPEELSGVLGGLGRRINATRGIETLPEPPGVTLFFEQKASAPPGGGWGWAMRPELRAALEDLDLLRGDEADKPGGDGGRAGGRPGPQGGAPGHGRGRPAI